MASFRYAAVSVSLALVLSSATAAAGMQDGLARGEVVISEGVDARGAGATRLLAVVEIKATPDRVVDAILDFQARAANSTLIDEATLYERRQRPGEWRVRWRLSIVGMQIVYHTVYRHDARQGRITWWLDRAQTNDISAAQGEYVVRPAPRRSGYVRLFYDFEVASKHRAPARLRLSVARRNVENLLDDIRRRAEAE